MLGCCIIFSKQQLSNLLLAGRSGRKKSEDIAEAQALWAAIRDAKTRRANYGADKRFKETVHARVQCDQKFRENLISEAAGCLLAGDF
jgi:hypothetical protein